MNAGAGRYAWTGGARGRVAARPSPRPSPLGGEGEVAATGWAEWVWRRVGARHVLVLLAVLVYPWVATPFFTFQIGAQSLALGLIALSLTFLAGYGGMVSLAQMTVAGIAGYMFAIFATSGTDISLRWPWGLAVVLALVIATACGTLIGWFSVRTDGIYTIMITLAIGVAFYYLAQQNYSLFNGFQGFQSVMTPAVGGVELRAPLVFYHLALFWALAGYFFVCYLLRAPFGVALQGIRDNPRRMRALGFMRHPVGPFVGAIVFVLLQNFAVDLVGRERFNLLIGGVFLVIVLFSPDGLLGWWAHGRLYIQTQFARTPLRGRRRT